MAPPLLRSDKEKGMRKRGVPEAIIIIRCKKLSDAKLAERCSCILGENVRLQRRAAESDGSGGVEFWMVFLHYGAVPIDECVRGSLVEGGMDACGRRISLVFLGAEDL